MKKFCAFLMLWLSLAFAGATLAQDKPAATPDKPAAEAAKPAAAEPAKPKVDKGDTAFMMVATVLVILMTIPGLALFYGGMVRAKNTLSVLMQVFVTFCLIGVVWVVYGYSLTFTSGNAFFGGFSKMFLSGVTGESLAATFSKGVAIPELAFVAFQLTFAGITCALVVGSFAERVKFSAMLVFAVLWFTFAYAPMAHWVWSPDGWLHSLGMLDFAGGTVVHINAGVTGLACVIMLGERKGYGTDPIFPHNLALTITGAALLWFGWFGFNAGSNLEANGYAVLAFANTLFATAVAAITWFFAEWIFKGKPSLLGIISGMIAGLVGITPACGFVGVQGALAIGLASGFLCFLAVAYLKNKLGYDDALDAFGVHAVGGIIGAILTGVFVDPAKGGVGVYENWFTLTVGYDAGFQVMAQVKAVLTAIVLSGGVAAITMALLKYTVGVRVTDEQESEGLDLAEHGEKAYNY